jgi:predicted dinucleotide-binding enzyme
MKTIGIIGSGGVGKTLGAGFLKHGYSVTIGSRDPSKLTDWLEKGGSGAKTGSFADAAKADIIVLAVKGSAALEALNLANESNLNGKTIIDATNPINSENPPEKGVLSFYTSLENSLMEQLQAAFPQANFVKAFNSVGAHLMVNPSFKGGPPSMFICGNNSGAKAEVSAILEQFGWEVEDMGAVEAARAIEPLCILWCIPGMLENKWVHAFKLLK